MAVNLFAALPAGAQWEVRTTGNDLNGGFFNTAGGSGTDYSQQDAAQFTVTDGATATTTLTSVTGGFTSAMVHNGVHLSGGTCTAGFYEITTFTNGNTVTIDRTGGTGTGCTVKVGGGLLTISTAFANVVWLGGVDYNGVWIKSGTYTLTAALSMPTGVYQVAGYQTAHGDNGAKPLITTATNSTALFSLSTGRPLITNLSFSNTAATRSFGISITGTGPTFVLSNCTFDGFSNAIKNSGRIPMLSVSSVEIKNSTLDGILMAKAGQALSCSGCYIHDNAAAGVSTTGGSASVLILGNSIFAANGDSGVATASSDDLTLAQSSDFVSNTGAGIAAASSGSVFSYNSIYYANTTYGISLENTDLPSNGFGITNAYGANGTAPTLNLQSGTGDVTLTANPFTSSTNFTLNSTAGGGALLKGTGYPGTFIGGTTTSHLDVGAVQSGATASVAGSACVQ